MMATLLTAPVRRLARILPLHSDQETGGRRQVAAECVVLVALMAAVGWMVVPAHWTSIWMDREFTGWVAPVANRLVSPFAASSEGIRLYADGGHVPMPPIPFVFMNLVTFGHATWLSESLANAVFQALTLMMMYAGLRRLYGGAIPFLATAAAIPIFFSLPKTIVYDSMAQCLAALAAVAALWHVRRQEWRTLAVEAGVTMPLEWFSPSILLMAAATAGCLLTKQSTGGGVGIGVAAALLLAIPGNVRSRSGDLVLFAAWTGIFAALLTVALLPWIDVHGMIHDVFLTGSEPKGGSLRLVRSLAVYSLEIGQQAFLMIATLVAALGAFTRMTPALTGEAAADARERTPLYVLLVPVLVALVTFVVFPIGLRHERLFTGCLTVARQLLWSGLLLGMVFSVLAIVRRDRSRSLPPLFLVLFSAAVFHSLSTPRFRWTYDNNPLIALAFALFLSAGLELLGRWLSGARRNWAVAGFLLAMLGVSWAPLCPQLAMASACSERWPEVAYLDGARLRAGADGMRRLVNVVREQANTEDRVLLLPNDPNVEAWFERERPRLSAPIVFADQYWDRLVDADLAAIETQLPKVVVIGPRNYWKSFHEIWQHNYGAGRLIETLQEQVLPMHYHLETSVPIKHRGHIDVMEVYVRNGVLTCPQ